MVFGHMPSAFGELGCFPLLKADASATLLPANTIKPAYDVVVVGSGYGGGVSASRLARAGLRVCVIERGREFLTGEFPAACRSFAASCR